MSTLKWDQTGEKLYETGVDRGVLYPMGETGTYDSGVAWNGLTKVDEKPTGAEATALWADNAKYLNLMSTEELGLGIEAYTYPDEFAACDGSATIGTGVTIGQQTRKTFGLAYRTLIGNDIKNAEYGYKIHLVYGCLASPSDKGHSTVNDSPEAITLSWEVSTTPVDVTGFKPTASLEIDSTKTTAAVLKLIEDKLYGTEDNEPTFLLPSEVIALVGNASN